MNKKIISTFLCFVVVIAAFFLLPTNASAATEGYYTYEVSNGQATITDVDTSIRGDITIPSTLGGYPVTSIGNSAFSSCGGLTSVIISDSVENIGPFAFENCSSLTSITIPESVSSIGCSAFYDCYALENVYISNIASWCNIDMDVEYWTSDYYEGWDVPYRYSANPFFFANNLYINSELVTDLVIPNGVTKINDYVFLYCSGLNSVTIPDSVTTIGSYAFEECGNMNFRVSINNPSYYSDSHGVLFNKEITDLILAPNSLPNGYRIPDSVTRIAYRAFSYCQNLISIELPGNVTIIEPIAFIGCSNLKNITIPKSITAIKTDAFQDCNKLENVYISDLAAWCNIDFSIIYNRSYPEGCRYAAHPLYYAKYLYLNGRKVTDLVIPEGIPKINDYAFFSYDGLNSVTIPESVSYIGGWAFYSCESLTSISIPASTKWDSWFNPFQYSCSNLKHAAYGGTSGVSFIMQDAEVSHYQTQLQAVDNCVETYGYCPVCDIYVFWTRKENGAHNYKNGACENCGITEEVGRKRCGENVFWDIDEQGVLTISGTGDMANYDMGSQPWYYYRTFIKKVVVSEGVTSIGSSAFSELENLTDATLSDSISKVGRNAFGMCVNLTSVNLPSGICEIADYSFYCCENLTSVILPNGIQRIGSMAFYGCKTLKNIDIPDGVTTIDEGAFYNCDGLTNVVIPDSVTSISNAFYECSNLISITLPNGLTTLESSSFEGCTCLTNIIIPESVSKIKDFAFLGCSSLKNITIPGNVTSIGTYAFAGCSKLSEIVIPASVTQIDPAAFANSVALKQIFFVGAPPSMIDSFYDWSGFVYYPTNNALWTEDVMQNYGGEINWMPYYNGLTYSIQDNQVTITGYVGSESELVVPSEIEGLPVTAIGDNAFAGCTFQYIEIPATVTSLGNCVFSEENGGNINQIKFLGDAPTVVPTWGVHTDEFCDCPDPWCGYTMDGTFAYLGATIFIPAEYSEWSTIVNETYNDRIDWQIYYTTPQVPIPDGLQYTISDYKVTITGYTGSASELSIPAVIEGYPVIAIADYAFAESKISWIDIPEGVITIGDYAFCWCENLPEITIPNSVIHIGSNAFQYCTGLTYVTLGSSIQAINSSTFMGCTWLSEIMIPNSVSSIGTDAFWGCSSLQSIEIPEGVTTIGRWAFYNCTSLKSAVLPKSVTSIGEAPFNGCSSLESITIPFVGENRKTASDNNQYPLGYLFGTYSYAGGVATKQTYYRTATATTSAIYFIPASLKTVTVTDGNILCGAFEKCSNLTQIIIGDGAKVIGDSAFAYCSGLNSVSIGTGVTSISNSAFYGCSALNRICVSDGNSTYSSDVYGVVYNKAKTHLVIAPQGLQGRYVVADGVTNIFSYAFEYCSKLTEIVIPKNVTGIAYAAFNQCTALTDVYYCGEQTQWNAISVGNKNDMLLNAVLHLHDYSDFTVTVAPTFTNPGQQEMSCSLCGHQILETLAQWSAEVSQWNVSLSDDLQVNFYMNISESITDTARVRIFVGENAVTYRVSKLEKTVDGLYIASIHVAAAQMTDYIFITVLNGNHISQTMSYTVRQYADTILADMSYITYHPVVREMLNYGAAAQVYFDYEADNLSNSGITGAGSAEIPDSVELGVSVTGNAKGVNFYGASLIFRDKIAIRYYFQFNGDIAECTFSANGKVYAPMLKDGLYYIELPDILPQNLDLQISLSVTDAAGNTLSVAYCPMDYIVRMNEKGSDALKGLVKALYNYHLVAKALETEMDYGHEEPDIEPDLEF